MAEAFNLVGAGERLKRQFGEEGAFFVIDRYRTGGLAALSPVERAAVQGIPPERLSEVDRYLEGGLSGAGFALAAGPYEALKPLIGKLAPAGSGFEEGPATSKPSMDNVRAAFTGAAAGGRLIPKSITGPLASFLAGLTGRGEAQRPMGGATAPAGDPTGHTPRELAEIQRVKAVGSPGFAMMRGLGFR